MMAVCNSACRADVPNEEKACQMLLETNTGPCGCIRYNGGDRYSGAPERDPSYGRSAGAAVPLERSPDRYGRAPAGGPDR